MVNMSIQDANLALELEWSENLNETLIRLLTKKCKICLKSSKIGFLFDGDQFFKPKL